MGKGTQEGESWSVDLARVEKSVGMLGHTYICCSHVLVELCGHSQVRQHASCRGFMLYDIVQPHHNGRS